MMKKFKRNLLSQLTSAALFTSLSVGAIAAQSTNNDDWLHVEGNQVKDMYGNTVWMTGANWFGFNTTERVFHGLWSVNLENTLQSIADRGINILRVPISTELLYEWQNGQASKAQVNSHTNPDLANATSLDVFDAMVVASKKVGLKILLDVHSAEADNMGHFAPLWYKGEMTSEVYYSTWEWVTERYKNDDTIIAFDLENEPHGKPWADSEFAKWDNSSDENNWKYACETAANRILDINPNMLVMCEGIESFPVDGKTWTSRNDDSYHSTWWGGNLRGVKDYPVDLGDRQSQFMYSPHDYGPLVHKQPWFYAGFNKDSLYKDVWKDNWMFIHEENIAPLLIGEWGGFMDGGDNETWMVAMRDLIIENRLHHTFWCINPNSGDTGGLLDHDWTTWDEEKYALFEPSLWKNEQGKFIGLDHQIALGSSKTGLSLNEYYQNQTTSVTILSPQAGSQVMAGANVNIGYNLTKAEKVNVYVDGKFVKTGPATGSVSVKAPADEGNFTIKLVAVDNAGTELSEMDSVSLTAVQEAPLNPEIGLKSPTDGTQVEVNAPINIEVSLNDAAGFEAVLGGETMRFDGMRGQINAPATAGSYELVVTALDDQQQSLQVSDRTIIEVAAVESGEVSCELGSVDVWHSGFVLNNIKVSNNSGDKVTAWRVVLEFPTAVALANGWNGEFSAEAQSIKVSNVSYNGNINPGQSTSFGLQGSHNGDFSEPTCHVE
ncbi:cellulase family glycosylhydrolase [Corallincola spongiicola]|nr:cellulase family glycosylhydrolase [Corallincola spongiicola]